MLRLAVIGLRAAGITVIATVHDAVLIEASAQDIDTYVAAAKEIMVAASVAVSGSFPLRVDHRIFRPGQRYFDARGVPMWNRIARWSRSFAPGGADLGRAAGLGRATRLLAPKLPSLPNKEERKRAKRASEGSRAIEDSRPIEGLRPIEGTSSTTRGIEP